MGVGREGNLHRRTHRHGRRGRGRALLGLSCARHQRRQHRDYQSHLRATDTIELRQCPKPTYVQQLRSRADLLASLQIRCEHGREDSHCPEGKDSAPKAWASWKTRSNAWASWKTTPPRAGTSCTPKPCGGTGWPPSRGHAEAQYDGTEWLPNRGLAVAQFNLGQAYQDGKGVLKDDAEAARWFRLAAE